MDKIEIRWAEASGSECELGMNTYPFPGSGEIRFDLGRTQGSGTVDLICSNITVDAARQLRDALAQALAPIDAQVTCQERADRQGKVVRAYELLGHVSYWVGAAPSSRQYKLIAEAFPTKDGGQ